MLDDLYKQKGQLLTEIELAQSRLRLVNEEIAKELNRVESKKRENNQEV